MLKTALIIGGGYLIWHTWEIKKSLEKLDYSISQFRVQKFEPEFTEVRLTLSISNPGIVNPAFQAFEGVIYYGDQPAGNFAVRAPKGIVIKSGQTTDVPLSVTLANKDTLNLIASLVGADSLDNLRIKGTITINGIPIPVDMKYGDLSSMSGIGKVEISRHEAFEMALDFGIPFSGNFWRDCSQSEAGYLEHLAKLSGYRKPKGDGSLARYFYDHLYKRYG